MQTSFWKEISTLIRRDIKLELRQKYALNGLLLYVVSTVFVCYLSFKRLTDVPTWNALLWIILLFTAVQAATKNFSTETRGRLIYYYTLASARSVIFARIIYNSLLMLVISLAGYVIYMLLIGDLVQDKPYFMLGILLGSLGFSGILTLMASIAGRTHNVTLMAILSFPVIIPMLIVLIRFSKNAVDGIAHSVQNPYIIGLLSMNLIVLALAWVLFPFLWKD
ncbi:MAG: heme exporter protein CcmB [Bacteroidia bacterium]|nr:heme exporter protein CcmB [Bacteroidia bacterium]MCC6768608.1 heme exporter protein CcmB [Bacteroidia bacterium]